MLAILLSFAVFFGWQQYMQKKYPDAYSKGEASVSEANTASDVKANDHKVAPAASTGEQQKLESATNINPAIVQDVTLTTPSFNFSSKNMDFKISTKGMAIFNLKLNEYNRRSGDPIVYSLPINHLFIDGSSNFIIQQTAENEFTGSISDGKQKVQVVYQVDPQNYKINAKISIQNPESKKNLVKAVSYYEVLPVSTSFLLPPTDHQEFFISAAGKIVREKVQPETVFQQTTAQVSLAAFNTQYFAQAFLNKADVLPTAIGSVKGTQAQLDWQYESVQPAESFITEYSVYLGPKKEDALKAVDESLVDMIDYGIFGFIGRPMHTALVWIYKLVGNWGLAIILITILLRTLILPAGVYSFRSMKKMQKVQPKLQAIKEKYKNDPQRANQETLLLLRAEKANPLSGCIPALLQLPIFIAFFSMMSCSFELYMQPFYGWIFDLSSKDPFYVFPVLAGATMFVQMRMTPTTTTDPAQAKIMSMMPILFTVFMLSTPSGLALYMFVGSLFSIFQQIIFMKEKTT